MIRRGQLAPVGFMIAVYLLLMVIIMIQPLKEMTSISRDSSHLDCTNTSLSTGQQMTCIVMDTALPLYIGFGIAVAIAYLGIKEYRENNQ